TAAVVALCVVAFLVLTSVVAGFAAERASRRASRFPWLVVPALLAATGGLVFLLVVPPFEGPDETAHVQYARYVAVTGELPAAPPSPDSMWRDYYYEWVQPPAAYVAAALLYRAEALAGIKGAGAREAALWPEPNPRSMAAGNVERTIYRHPS